MQKPSRKQWTVYPAGASAYNVYADDMKLTAAGDAIFQTLVEGGFVDGQQTYELNCALVLRSGTWDKVAQFVNGEPLYSQSGCSSPSLSVANG